MGEDMFQVPRSRLEFVGAEIKRLQAELELARQTIESQAEIQAELLKNLLDASSELARGYSEIVNAVGPIDQRIRTLKQFMSKEMSDIIEETLDLKAELAKTREGCLLTIDEDSASGRMIRESIWAMSKRLDNESPGLAAELRSKIKQVGLWRIFTNDTDTFVALYLDDLPDVYKDHYGATMAENNEEMEEWYEETNLDKPMTIWCEEDDYDPKDPQYPPDAEVTRKEGDCRVYITATRRAWAKANGRGFLCSTEY